MSKTEEKEIKNEICDEAGDTHHSTLSMISFAFGSFIDEIMNVAFGGSTDLYDTLGDYFKDIREKGVSSNLAFFIPHGNVRAFVLGTKEGEPTQEQLDKMKELIEDGMKSGAFGMSTGLVYPPGSESSTEELIELSKVVNSYGGIYMSHIRNEGSHIIDVGMEEVFRIANEANIPVQVSHWSVISKYAQNLTDEVINLVREKQEEGMKIKVDVIPYDEGFTSLSFILLPTWVYENFNENLTDPAKRKKVIDAIFEKLYSMFFADAPFYIRLIPKFILKKLIFTSLAKIVRVLDADKYKDYIGKTLKETLNEVYPDKNIYDSLLDFMKDENGRVVIQIKHKDEDINVIPMLVLDFACISSDGLLVVDGNAHPMSHGAFVRILERYVREKNLISLEEAIRKMSSLPASILGIDNRGIIKEGYKADLVIFNLDKIKEKGTLVNGCQFPEGINYVLVNGKITAANGIHEGVLNGRILKHNK
ncbi:MAG: amidohydrolase family protein [Candidatus Lokiarchaeota archaeon]|nr:amidohydrolase family protein [Candidatus Lokiarchaeota archaeon]MBD3200202.1 amidohydrolase family protein [Candidatus Lokiarchaeota archaeon]